MYKFGKIQCVHATGNKTLERVRELTQPNDTSLLLTNHVVDIINLQTIYGLPAVFTFLQVFSFKVKSKYWKKANKQTNLSMVWVK